jgi:hypothetical protein
VTRLGRLVVAGLHKRCLGDLSGLEDTTGVTVRLGSALHALPQRQVQHITHALQLNKQRRQGAMCTDERPTTHSTPPQHTQNALKTAHRTVVKLPTHIPAPVLAHHTAQHHPSEPKRRLLAVRTALMSGALLVIVPLYTAHERQHPTHITRYSPGPGASCRARRAARWCPP